MGDVKAGHIKLGIGDALVPLHAHIAHFVESDDDFAAAVSYLEEGLRGTDHCVIFGHSAAEERVVALLAAHGFDTSGLAAAGRLVFVGGEETGEGIIDTITGTFNRLLAAGASVIRLFGNIGWLEQGWPSVRELVSMEAKVSLAAEKYPCVFLCLYDLRNVPSFIMRHGGMETHPLVLRGSLLEPNPLALPTETILRQLESLRDSFAELERKKEEVRLYQKVFANMRDALVIVRQRAGGGEPAVVELNPEAQRIAGCGDACQRTLSDCFPGLLTPDFGASCSRLVAEGGSLDLGERSVGSSFFHAKLFSLFGEYLGIVFYDTTERKRMENALLSLRRLGTALQSTLEIENILDQLIAGAAAIVGAENGVAAVCSTEEMTCYRYLIRGAPQQERWDPVAGVPGRVVTGRGPYLSNDPRHDPHILPARAERYGVRNVVSTPILDLEGNLLGFLEIHNKSDGSPFTGFDQDQLASAAQTAALAVRNATAFRKITQMGARLRESTERYRHLVDGLDAIVWEADAESFRFSFVSHRAEAILGYPISRWLEEPNFWADHIHPEDRDRAVAICRRATAEGRDHHFVYRAIAADGRTVWMRDHVKMEFDSARRVRQLRGVMVDITGTMAIEDQLRRSEAKFRSTFEGAGIGMVLVDAEGNCVEVNPALQEMLGYTCHELSGTGFSRLSSLEPTAADREQFRALMGGTLPRYQAEKRFVSKDGRELWGRLTVSPVRLDGGTQYAIGMIEDITERKKAEAEVAELLSRVQRDAAELEDRVRERTAQLEETNAELDSFAHSVSHDLRAPLRAMRGYVELLMEEELQTEAERQGYLKRIMFAADGMDRLIQDLLAYSRLSRQEIMLQSVSLATVVREAAEQLELASGGKRYLLEVSGELPEVMGHHAVLVQVLLNLMTNGIKFVAAGVTPKLRIWTEQTDHHCRLFVQDNGIGIPEEHQERIFKIFERLHGIETYPGTGVGLAIVRKAVLRLGGRIGVISREGEGSRFWIELTLAGAAGVSGEAAEP
jgi:PAS domain S-box-containing protein